MEFEGQASISAGDVRVVSPATRKGAKEATGRKHRSRIQVRLPGGDEIDYVAGRKYLPADGSAVFLGTVEKGKVCQVFAEGEKRKKLPAFLSCHPGQGRVEFDISMPGYTVASKTAKKTELASSIKLSGVFVWDLVLASRSWKRVPASDGQPAGKWIPHWDKDAANDGWRIPPSEKQTAAKTRKKADSL